MSLLSKLFGPPVKQWEQEYAKRGARPKTKHKGAEKSAEPTPIVEQEEEEEERGFISRVLQPSLKSWEQEYAGQGVAPRFKDVDLEEELAPESEPTTKLQAALRVIAKENRDIPDMFRKKAKKPLLTNTNKKEATRKPGRYLPVASLPEIDGAVTSAIAAVGFSSPEYFDEILEASQYRLKGKTVDLKTLTERVKTKLA